METLRSSSPIAAIQAANARHVDKNQSSAIYHSTPDKHKSEVDTFVMLQTLKSSNSPQLEPVEQTIDRERKQIGIWELDLQSDTEYWSHNCFELVSTPAFKGTLASFQSCLHPDDVEGLMAKIANAIERRTSFNVDVRLRSDAICDRVLTCCGECEFNANRQPKRILGTLRELANKNHREISGSADNALRTTFDHLLEGCQILDSELRYIYLNPIACRHGRRNLSELIGRRMVDVYPGIEDTEIYAAICQSLKEQTPREMRNQFTFPDGSSGEFEIRILPASDGVVVLSNETTERKQAEAIVRQQSQILEQIAVGEPLDAVLQAILELVEGQIAGSKCSVYLVDKRLQQLRFGAGQSLQTAFVQAMGNIPIGPLSGSCGTAAYLGLPVIVTDIATDPLWERDRTSAHEQGPRSCWSVPIISRQNTPSPHEGGAVSGTFAVYQKQSYAPGPEAEAILEVAVHLARLAIDRDQSHKRDRDTEARIGVISEITRSVTFALRFHADGSSRVEWVHPHFGLLSGYNEEECNRRGWEYMFHTDDRIRVRQFFSQICQGAVLRDEFRYATKSGDFLNVRIHGKLLESGPLPNEGVVIGGLLDITELKSAENELRASEERFQLALRGANDGLWDWDLKSNQIFFSPRWKSMLGYADAQLPDAVETWMRLLHADDKPALKKQLRQFLNSSGDNFESEFRMRHQSSGYRNILCRGFLMRNSNGRPVRMVGTHQDITERKQADEELRGSRQRLESLSRQLIATRETELRHLARELHDEIGQVLTAMKMNVRGIQRSADEQVRMRLDENLEMIDQAVTQVRNLSLNMRPPHLDALGLAAALHWYLNQQAKIGGFQFRLIVDPPELQVPNELSVVCFRITQEAVTNAMRHAAAGAIEIELRQTGDELHLFIRDDGKGFDISEARQRAIDGASLGLIGMQERASLAEGRVEITSIVDTGTTIHALFLNS